MVGMALRCNLQWGLIILILILEENICFAVMFVHMRTHALDKKKSSDVYTAQHSIALIKALMPA